MSFFYLKSLLCILSILSFCNPLFAQKDVTSIAKEYQIAMDNIERQEYHLNEFKINANRFNIHHDSYFQYFERYFYTFDRREESKNQPILKVVILKTERKGIQYHKEFVYDNEGNFIFYLEQQREAMKKTYSKISAYFDTDGKILKWLENDEDKSEERSNKGKQIVKTAKDYLDKFQKHMEEIRKLGEN